MAEPPAPPRGPDSGRGPLEGLPHLRPMKAVSGPLPTAGDWAYEIKWDGMRLLAYLAGGRMSLRTVNDLEAADRFPELDGLRRAVAAPCILDGELVAFDERGLPSFGRLSHRIHRRGGSAAGAADGNLAYMVFDLLHLDGRDLWTEPWTVRRDALESLGLGDGPWRVPEVHDDGPALLDACERLGLEGVVSKRRDAPYAPGRRSRRWIKTKVRPRQEFVIAGWLPGSGRLEGRIGSIIVGYHDPDGRLRYAGRVGTGFTEEDLDDLAERLAPLEIPASPFAEPTPVDRVPGVRWVRPELVAEVAFAEWTADGLLRQPSFLGLRIDKDPAEVIREPPAR